jgi:IMP dehydrogenase
MFDIVSGASYDDIGIVADRISDIDSRSKIEPLVDFCGQKIYPFIAAPMPDVCDGKMALLLSQLKCYGFIHRFQPISEQIKDYLLVKENCGYAGCALPLNGWEEWYEKLKMTGCNSFLLDCANGASTRVLKVIESIGKECYLTVGNVHSSDTFNMLSEAGAHAIRTGIAGGSACTTKLETGIYRPMIETLEEISRLRKGKSLIIADGGIKKPADSNKALIWSDLVMMGNVFAQCPESPSKVIRLDGHLKKVYRGAASYSTQVSNGKKHPTYIEGMESLIDVGSSLDSVVTRFVNGLRSSMSYVGARNLSNFQNNVRICRVK